MLAGAGPNLASRSALLFERDDERTYPTPLATGGDDRPVRPARHLPAGLRHRPLRFPLLLLHVGAHDVPAQEGLALARGTRSAVYGLRDQGRAEVEDHRRRAAG